MDAVAREVIDDAGHGDHFGHGTGHGIGLATHEAPSLGKRAPETPLPSPTVVLRRARRLPRRARWACGSRTSIHFDAAAGRVERMTRFPREVLVVGR